VTRSIGIRGIGFLGVVGMVVAACQGEPTSETSEAVLRLDGRSFGATASAHAPLVDVGGVALPVPYARDVHRSVLVETSPARDGRVHALVSVPTQVVGWPRSAFALAVRADIGSVAPKMDRNTTETFALAAIRLQRGWRVRFDPRRPARGKVTAAIPTASEGRTSLVQLEAIAPMPPHMTSDRFDLPAGSVLTLQYGLADRAPRASAKPVCFRSTLDCAWWWTRTLVSDCVTAGDPAGSRWHEVEVPFRWAGRRCALTLDTDGSGAGDPLWAIPTVRAPSVVDPVDHPNVVLISLDTLRADHLSGYGYPRATSPSLDELVLRTGTVFANAVATYPMTHISHLSIFTGLFPAALPANGVLTPGAPIPTLTELLRDAGFTTLGVTEDALVSKEYGFGRGFDRLVELHPQFADRARLVFAQGRDLVRTMRHRRFFLFLHNYKVHSPYLPSPPYATLFQSDEHPAVPDVAPEFRDDRDAYDRSIRELDDEVGAFLRTLDAEGLADRTLLIVLSDHGEALGEHGLRGHGFWAYEDALHVVLAFRGPGIVGKRVMNPVSLADVAPTVLDVLGLPVPSSMQGRSLKDALLGTKELTLQPTFFEWNEWNGEHARGVRVANMKLVRTGDGALMYDLARDPREEHPLDVRGRTPSMLALPLAQYEADGARRRASLDASQVQSVSPEVGQSLRALGYVE
jgi:arylsulfatase A-like enzyme